MELSSEDWKEVILHCIVNVVGGEAMINKDVEVIQLSAAPSEAQPAACASMKAATSKSSNILSPLFG